MLYYSTNDFNNKVDLKEAVLSSLASDKGLYMPEVILPVDADILKNIELLSFQELSYEIASKLIGDNIPKSDLRRIINETINFDAPLVYLDDTLASLELWHGESMAFKDFGARFMSRLMNYFIRNENKEYTVLVATSGDTGGAVAAGFYNTPGIRVVILYPSGRVSEIQEKQLTTWGNNITAIEVSGSFDDCQALVKRAFLDTSLDKKLNLSSANSINIARLIPQTFYYFEAYKQIRDNTKPLIFAVPSGNFGNLTAGLIAKKMGLPVDYFVAATNINHVVPDYLTTGTFDPVPSRATISNAMDVGNPSNFTRILSLYGSTWNKIRKDIKGFWLDDDNTKKSMLEAYKKYHYITDPHGAIGFAACNCEDQNTNRVFLETAHPCKFLNVVEETLGITIEIPEKITSIMNKSKTAHQIENVYSELKDFLLTF
ncbi:MAG: threonine synthase [Saprospiraceae bacterium]|nr:threonine synthase [Saprospiraceae bacterium]MBK6782778.1 threonine synthase [Saprospiraceae bacterium]MBK7523225.1 threonine synthase [Saprospiraceae bacterium]MBK8371786.1 threonine synthase [Saprospiraceae bacterium]MBK8547050.1 threonine synthase [Saprospiraceae bacterium]